MIYLISKRDCNGALLLRFLAIKSENGKPDHAFLAWICPEIQPKFSLVFKSILLIKHSNISENWIYLFMNYEEAKSKYIQAWGTLGANWGINKAMAQIHALLLISPKPLCTDTIMEELKISRGNANMTLRSLMDWGIVTKVFIPGERKEFFVSEKDVWELSRQVMKERRKRELEPAIKVLKEVSNVELDGSEESKEFKRMTTELANFAGKADNILQGAMKAEENWFFKAFLRFVK